MAEHNRRTPSPTRPELADKTLVEAYGHMVLTRAFDDTMVAAWKQGRGLGGAFSQKGHEAIAVAAGMVLNPDDIVAPMHRDLGTYLVRGMTPERIFGNLLGKVTGPTRGRDANLHGLGDLQLGIIGFVSHIPQSLPVALGVAMSFKIRGQPRVALTTIGDGGFTAGLTHESLNMASLYEAPLVLIVENNKFAYSTPLAQQMRSARYAEKVAAYDIPSETVDGNDFHAMYHAVSAGVDRARSGGGPTVIEADTMRMRGHAIHDGAEYVPEELLELWKSRDPILRLRGRLLEDRVATSEQLDAIDHSSLQRVKRALEIAQAAPIPDASTLHEGVFA